MPRALLGLVLGLVLGLTSPTLADTLLDGSNHEVAGVVVDGVRQPLAGVEVRIVGESFVIELRSNASGAFRVRGLPPGRYRIEPARGEVRDPDLEPVGARRIRLDRSYTRCCICAMTRRSPLIGQPSVTAAARVDIHSTAQGVTISKPGWSPRRQ